MKVLGYFGKTAIGKVAGPLDSAASAAPITTEGVTTMLDAGQLRDQRMHDQTGGYFPEPEDWRSPQPAHTSPGPEKSPPKRPGKEAPPMTPEEAVSRRRSEQRAQDILDSIQIKLQMEEANRNHYRGRGY